jgi:hypothetical protein
MKTPLLLFAIATLSGDGLLAQEIPGETPGDLGWIVHGLDTLTLVRAADGHVWSQQNLGATAVANVASQSDAYGHLYQWGRWEDGHQLPTSATAQASTLPANNPSGLGTGSPFFYIGMEPAYWWSAGSAFDSWQGSTASALNGIDPCATLGPEWQLPEQADWINVLTAEGIMGTATALSSNLRLPAAGSRHWQSGVLINVGAFGNYWSSTPSGQYAKDVTIGVDFVNADDDAYRAYGMPCRCMNKSLHTGLAEGTDQVELALFPNPSIGVFTVRCDQAMRRITVYDALSRVAATVPVSAATATIEVPGLSPGLHIVRVETAGGTHYASLVIEQ